MGKTDATVRLHVTPASRQEGRGSPRHVIGSLLGRLWRIWRGGMCGVERKGLVPVWSAALLTPTSMEDNGSWVLTSDRLLLPCPIASAPLWDGRKTRGCIVIQEETSSSIPEPPFLCMDEAVSLFSKDVIKESGEKYGRAQGNLLVRTIFVLWPNLTWHSLHNNSVRSPSVKWALEDNKSAWMSH